MSLLKPLLPLLLLAVLAGGQEKFRGECPAVQALQNFNQSRILGTWYEQASYKAAGFKLFIKCSRLTYSDAGNDTLRFITRYVLTTNGAKTNITLEATPLVGPSVANFSVNFNGIPISQRFSFIDTDYDNHAILWDCFGEGAGETANNTQTLSVWTRNRSITALQESDLVDRVESFGLDATRLLKTDQTNCSAQD